MNAMLRAALGIVLVVACACQSTREHAPRFAPPAVRASAVAHERSAAAQTERVLTQDGFAGVWRTSYGTLRLNSSGERIFGHYDYGGGAEVEGRIENGDFAFDYVEPDGARGRGLFRLAADGAHFDGVWQADPDARLALDDAGLPRWTGERIVPVAGRVWLIVLEQRWEESLAEHEYSYGDMLRAFFQRLPQVEVRQRYFHDKQDLVRFLREIGGLVEPVIVYISSHGSPEGISAGSDSVDGRTIGEALRAAGDITLLHFGACSVMAGSVAHEVRASQAPHAPFPISGFRLDADWSGSAIVDFTYLDLILERGLAPAEAAEQVRSMLSFADSGADDDAAIGTVDLMLLDAETDG